MKSIKDHNKEIKQAHKIHASALQPFLQKIDNLVKRRPKSSNFKLQQEIRENERLWRKYCTKYQATHKTHRANREAFIVSVKMYFKQNEICTDEDFVFIFES